MAGNNNKKTHYDELSKFIQAAEAAEKVGGKGSEAAAPYAAGGGSESAVRAKGGKAPSRQDMMRDIEERDEAAGRISAQPQARPGGGQQLVEFGAGDNMLQQIAEQQGMRYVKLPEIEIEEEAIQRFDAEYARSNKCLPLYFKEDKTLVVAISDPMNVMIVDNLRLLMDCPIEAVVADENDIVDYIDEKFSHSSDIEELMGQLEAEGGIEVAQDKSQISLDAEDLAHAAPVIKLVNLILMRALKDRASDLHIEPFATTLRVRYRVDGVLREIPPPPKSLQVGLTSRLKIMANMNIAESRRPQDGRIRLTHQGREVDLRVSCLPTVYGEAIVMRILDKQQMMVGIEQIGMTKSVRTRFVEICKRPNGVVLVTGPTGSGKTTTLYAAVMNRLNEDEKFITTEDPVEYEVPGLVQVNINSNVGLTFAACLRAILRQDPEVILVGEIRDVETAQIATQASLTGHLVFSTLHTNSAAGTVSRLIDMGIEPFLLTSTLQVVIGQRLVRTLCQSCRSAYTPSAGELEDMCLKREEIEGLTFYRGDGCDECSHTGYRGRLGLFEMLEISEEINELILDRATADEIHEMAFSQGMQTMRQDGLIKVCMGVTSFSEVGHHAPRAEPDEIRREVGPIIQQVRERMLGASAPIQPQHKAAEALPPPVAAKPASAAHGQVPPGPGGVMSPLPNLAKLPGGAMPDLGSDVVMPGGQAPVQGEAAAFLPNNQPPVAPRPTAPRPAASQPAMPQMQPPTQQRPSLVPPSASPRPMHPVPPRPAAPASPALEGLPAGLPDDGSLSFLSTSSLESDTPLAEFPEGLDFSHLEGMSPDDKR